MDERAQYKTSLGLANRAFEYIARYGTPPTPHAFELFYTVCAGQNAALNEALAGVIADKRTFSAKDTEQLYQQFLTPEPPAQQMETIGAKMGSEMRTLLSLLGAAATSANMYQTSLQNAEERLNNAPSEQIVSELIRSLHTATQTMARTNSEVTANLETSQAQVEQLENCLKLAREESSRDALTGLIDRHRFDLSLNELVLDSDSSEGPASLLVLDIDNFKAFNDAHGLMAGDSALRYVANCIKSSIKGRDTAARYRGKEFAVILPDTCIAQAASLAERMRHLIHSRHLVKKATGVNMGRISVSVGVTEIKDSDDAESFMQRAEMCMYAAKNAGRNQVQDSPAPQAPENVATDAA